MKPFDVNGAFAPYIPGGSGLRRMAMRGAGVAILSGGAVLAIQIVSTAVLARLITPREFGLVAMVTTFSILLESLGTNGVIDSIVQCKDIDHPQASNFFWVCFAGGLLLAIGFAASGSLVGRFYGEPAVAPIAIGISITIFASSISGLHLGLLKRAMRYRAVAVNNIAARIISVSVSVVFARAGWGYWALVFGACVLSFSTTVGAYFQCQWMPGLPRRAAGTGAILSFAGYANARFVLNYFARNADNVLVGWLFGPFSLGFYKKAYDLFVLPASQLVAVSSSAAVSALSRVREDRSEFSRLLFGAISILALVGMGLAGCLTLIGKDLIRVLLGPGWETAGQIFRIFAPGIGIMLVHWTHSWIHVSLGRADRWLRWGILEWTFTIALFVVLLHWGPKGIAVAWNLSFWTLAVPAIWYAGRPIGLRVGDVVASIWRYIAASSIAAVTCALTISRLAWLSSIGGASGAALRIAIVSLSFTCLYLAAIVALFRGFTPLRTMMSLLRGTISMARTSRTRAAEVVSE